MSHYMEFLNNKIKEVKEYWTWSEVEKLLDLEEAEQRLLCFLWTYSKEYGRELTQDEFFKFYQELKVEEPAELPIWVYEMEGQVVLSPVVRSWLDGEVPKLPKGAEFYLTMQEKAYDLDTVFADMQEIFKSFEMSADKAVICIEGETGSGRTFCMKQICARQDLTLLVLDADEFAGTERELNACMLCAKLYDAFVCVKLGKEVREKLLTQLSDCFRVFGLIKDEKRELTESLDVMLYTRKLMRPARTLKTVIAREMLGEWIGKLSIRRRFVLAREGS